MIGAPPANVIRWDSYIDEAARAHGIPCYVIAMCIWGESEGHALRANGEPVVSSSGAIGLMQVMPYWLKSYNDRFKTKIDVVKFLHDPRLQIMVGTWVLAVKRYHIGNNANAGQGYPEITKYDPLCILAAYHVGFSYDTGKIDWAAKDGAGNTTGKAIQRYTRYMLEFRQYYNE